MKRSFLLWAMLPVVALALEAVFSNAEVASTRSEASLPASLDALYPPQAPAPLYLIAMHELNMPLAGMVGDVLENDLDNARQNLERFKQQYQRVAELVPEWQHFYTDAPLAGLDAALESGNPGMLMEAMGPVDGVCHGCHVQYMGPTHFKYRWDDFESLSITDPSTDELIPFRQAMQMLNLDLSAIGNDLQQQQIENARNHAQMLAARFVTLKEVCEACHETPRSYFVSDDITGMIDSVQAALANASIDPAKVGGLLQGIGEESCGKCHLVHAPAALSKH